jgi:hypothetical protein
MCAGYGIALLCIIYALTMRLTSSIIAAMITASIVACNSHFIFAVCQLRAELASLTWMLAACLVAAATDSSRWPTVRPVLFGATCAMAVLSKIQILPLLLLAACIYLLFNKTPSAICSTVPTKSRSWRQGSQRLPLVILVPITALLIGIAIAFLHTAAISGTPRGLAGYPKWTGVAACTCVALAAVGAAFVNVLVKATSIRYWSKDCLGMMFGGAIALLLVVIPNLLHGGVGTAWRSLNRLCFGVVSYACHGLQGDMDFGMKLDLFSGVKSLALFQPGTGLPLIGKQDALVVVGVCVAVLLMLGAVLATWRERASDDASSTNSLSRPRESLSPSLAWLAVACFVAAVTADATFVRRTQSEAVGTTYGFYHLFTVPIYLLALTLSAVHFSGLAMPWVARMGRLASPAQVVGVVAIGFAAVFSVTEDPRVLAWRKPEKPVQEFHRNLIVIGGVAPEFHSKTSCSLEALQAEAAKIAAARFSSGASTGSK